jgi:membrane protein
MHTVVGQTAKSSNAIKSAAGIFGTLWAASAGVSAVVVSLNVVYELTKTRPLWKQKVTVLGLTVSLTALIIFAVVLVLYGGKIGNALAMHFRLGHAFTVTWAIIQWPFLFAAMSLSFAVIYYLGPDVREASWR